MKRTGRLRTRTDAERAAKERSVSALREGRAALAALRAPRPDPIADPSPPTATAAVLALAADPPVLRVVNDGPRRIGEPTVKTIEVIDEKLLDAVRSMPCCLCGKPGPSDPHHFPTKGALGVRVDLLVMAVCRRCHDLCQTYAVAEEVQLDEVGRCLATHLGDGRVVWPAIEPAIEAIPQHWKRGQIRAAIVEALQGRRKRADLFA